MRPKKRLGKMRINNRKNEEYCSLFECPVCGEDIIKPTGEGNRLTACSQSCAETTKEKKAYKPFIVVNGYKYIYKPNHPNAIKGGRYVAEHRLVLEDKIGRLLTNDEVAHHKNGDKQDNRPENLELMTFSKHSSHHAKERLRNERKEFV